MEELIETSTAGDSKDYSDLIIMPKSQYFIILNKIQMIHMYTNKILKEISKFLFLLLRVNYWNYIPNLFRFRNRDHFLMTRLFLD